MISVFLGEDTARSRKAALEAFIRAQDEDPVALVSRFDDLNFDPALVSERFNAESLFGGGNILYLEGILEHPDGESFYRTIIQDTPHTVIVWEKSFPKDLHVFMERTSSISTFDPPQKKEKQVNNFVLTDAIGARDKKRAWVEFEKVRRSGAAMEGVHGTVFWIWKSMYLAAMFSKEEVLATGMKDYPYQNALRFSKNYQPEELSKRLRELKDMYHQAHRGEGEFEVLLERFILSL